MVLRILALHERISVAYPFWMVSGYESESLDVPVGMAEPSPPTLRDVVAALPEDSASLFCLLFYSRATTLDRELADYVEAEHKTLDALFGPDLQGFAIPTGTANEGQHDNRIYDFARMYGVNADQLPCALFSTDLATGRALKLPFGKFFPPQGKRRSDDIAMGFRLIAGAAERTASASEQNRIRSFQRSLRRSRRRDFGDRTARGGQVLRRVAANAEEFARIAKSGQTIVAIAASMSALFFGGPMVSAAVEIPSPQHQEQTRVVEPEKMIWSPESDDHGDIPPRFLADSLKARPKR